MARAANTGSPRASRNAERQRSRSAARLAVVQALYQMELTGGGVDTVIAEFRDYRLGGELEGAQVAEADAPFFADIVKGVVSRQIAIDKLVNSTLAEGWRLARLDSILRALLRAATLELMARPDVDARVVIDEYVEVARAFFGGPEPGFINGVLDRIARRLRADEFPADAAGE